MSKPNVIAFYLPQYHPTPDNDKWWGKGFTEWTNVGKAKPLFPGHYQPKVPADLGYYDLRLPEVREAQAELAREAGVYGFCYYHYWFGNGKQELELPFNEVLRLGKPDFPFMLCWANESWHRKFWNKDGKGSSKEMLIEQTYPEGDAERHFYHLLPAFRDPRYIRIDGKPAFMIYKPMQYPDVAAFITKWQDLARQNGLPGIHFIGHMQEHLNSENVERLLSLGFSALNTVGLYEARKRILTTYSFWKTRCLHNLLGYPVRENYLRICEASISEIDKMPMVYPSILPNWDHTPRSGKNGWVLTSTSPAVFKSVAKKICSLKNSDGTSQSFIFLKSWNEWGEGNYMEPDLKFHKGYITALHEALTEI